MVWRELFGFDYNITITDLKYRPPGSRQTTQAKKYNKLWTSPAFQISSNLRIEAGEEFCRINTFACNMFQSLPYDLGHGISSFTKKIRKLAITWPTLDSSCIANAKFLRTLKELRSIDIYVNMEVFRSTPRNSIGGLDALRSIINLPNPKLPNLKTVRITDIKANFKDFRLFIPEIEQVMVEQYPEDHAVKYSKAVWDPSRHEQMVGVMAMPLVKMWIEDFDYAFSKFVLDAKSPGTTYANGREPYRPSKLWPEREAARARHCTKSSKPYRPVTRLLKDSVVQKKLRDIEQDIRLARENRQLLIREDRRERLEAMTELQERIYLCEILPYHTCWEDEYMDNDFLIGQFFEGVRRLEASGKL